MKSVLIIILAFASAAFAQERHRVEGVVKTSSGEVVPALSLLVQKDGKDYRYGGLTDTAGRFVLELEPGTYRVTATGISPAKFTLHLQIEADGPKPDYLDLTLDPSELCEISKGYPQIIKSEMPFIPPAAEIIRARGQVSVEVKIRPDGTVSSAKVISGHPLLRAISVRKASQFVFVGSGENAEREATIAFVFTDAGNVGQASRFECAYRIVVDDRAITKLEQTKPH